jgi:hypothetical protein
MSDPYKRDRRLGRWFVSGREMAAYPGHLEAIQRSVVILDIKRDWSADRVEFVGRCEQFEIVPEGEEIPLYRPHVLAGEVRWEVPPPLMVPKGFKIDPAMVDWQPGSPIRLLRTEPERRDYPAFGIWSAFAIAWKRWRAA